MVDVDKIEFTPPALAHPIAKGLVRACRQVFGKTLKAVVLTGSLARNEATYVNREGRAILQSDVEALVVLHEDAALPSRASHDALCHLAEHLMDEQGVNVEVSFSVVHPGYLRALPPHIYSYELRCCGLVLWGEPEVLHLIPPYTAAQLSQEDAWRILSNRLLEQMTAAANPDGQALARYRSIKLCLDLTSSLLVFCGRFEAGYRARLLCMEKFAASPEAAVLPFDFAAYMPLLRQCVASKLDSGSTVQFDADFETRVVAWAWRVWHWELCALTSCSEDSAVEHLLRAFGAQLGHRRLLRGWAYAVRRRGWLASAPHWLHWLSLFAEGLTPRHAIYLALYRWQQLRVQGVADFTPACELLPVSTSAARSSAEVLAGELMHNYKEFAVETRA
ncbi:MAG: hypothetical protein P4M01_10960 [Acidobacteriota bacterium]|nr:hypothetical protein [Acidobacteriota bacterium]